jgi:hypothetical protein
VVVSPASVYDKLCLVAIGFLLLEEDDMDKLFQSTNLSLGEDAIFKLIHSYIVFGYMLYFI